MDKNKLKQLQQMLLTERKELIEEIKHMSTNQLDGSMSEVTGELSAYDNHPADLGSEMFERSKDMALREGIKHRLNHIEDALQHMKIGTYGSCDDCGKQIAIARLEAMPSTTLCIDCKAKTETTIDPYQRPIEEDVVAPPYGGLIEHDSPKGFHQGDDYIMFDGEDAWQEVARYGTSETPQDLPNMKDYQQMTADADEDRGKVDDVDGIPYFRGADGMFYEDIYSKDDESAPIEVIIGDENWDMIRRINEKQFNKPKS
jgi:YteA family regulatory protein